MFLCKKVDHKNLIPVALQVLGLVHYLVKFGYYGDTKDIQLLLQPLLNLLDGRNDKPYPKSRSMNSIPLI